MKQNVGLSAIIIAAIAFVIRSGAPGPQAAPEGHAEKPKAETVDKPKPPPEPEGPWQATRSFFQADDEPKAPSLPGFDISAPKSVRQCVTTPKCKVDLVSYFGIPSEKLTFVQFVVATVPDPSHTRLSLFTDTSIQAIEDAAAASKWIFATQWLPWIDSIDPTEKDPEQRQQQRQNIRRQERQPGILVFRRPQVISAGDVLVIFLVGETPTAGVNSQQFQLARAYMRAIHEPRDRVSILGPTFSGSFYSLAGQLIEDRKQVPFQAYRVRAGSVQGVNESNALTRLYYVEFRGASANTVDHARYFATALEQLGIQPDHAAKLIEDESAFGNDAAQDELVRVFRFPRDISHLRNAYRDAVAAARSSAGPAPDIEFSIKDPDTGEDSIPIFSAAQSPLSQNGVVSSIVDEIRRDNIRLVWVEATNVLDLLFLANVLKRQCPDTRLLLNQADVLLVQAAQNEPLTGTLVLASYPMFPESNHWMGDVRKNQPVTFSDASAEGSYNAAVLLLNNDAAASRILADYYWHRTAGKLDLPHPPTWLLTLDRRGFLPVNVFAHTKQDEDGEKWFQQIKPNQVVPIKLSEPARNWHVIATIAALTGFAVCLWIGWISWQEDYEIDDRFSLRPIGPGKDWRRFHIFALLLTLLTVQSVIGLPALRPFLPTPFMVLLTLSGIAVLVAASFGLVSLKPGRRENLAAALVMAGSAVCIILWVVSCQRADDRSLFFAFRARELRFGSSPTWPIVASLSALALFEFVQLTRCHLVACRKPDIHVDGLRTALAERLKEGWNGFNSGLESSFRWRLPIREFLRDPTLLALAVAIVAGVVLGILFRAYAQMRSIDGRPYNLLALAIHLLVIALLLLTSMHVRLLWRSLETFLGAIGELPIALSFQPVDQSRADRPIWVRRVNLQSIDVHIQAIYVLHNMALLADAALLDSTVDPAYHDYLAALRPRYDKYRTRIRKLLEVHPDRRRGERLRYTKILGGFNLRIAKKTFEFLSVFWAKHRLEYPDSGNSPIADGKPSKPSKDLSPVEELASLAQKFVALHYSSFVLYAVRQIQNLLIFTSSGFVLLMISLNCYSIQAPQFVGRFLLVLFLILGTVIVSCLVGLEKDPVVSRIGGSEPGELNTGFYLKIAGYGALPVLSLLASQYPAVSNFLLSWVEPSLESFK